MLTNKSSALHTLLQGNEHQCTLEELLDELSIVEELQCAHEMLTKL